MKIAIDVSPLKNSKFLQHRVRGTGFYIENLKRALLKYFPENKYIFFVRGEKIPKLSSWPVDLIHYPYFEPFFLSLPLLNKFKTIVTVHDLTPLVFPREFQVGLKGSLKWQIQKTALKRTNGIITDSVSSKNDIIRFTGIPENKVSVAYLAAAPEFRIQNSEFRIKEIKKKYNLPDKFVLYVGDVTWNKNLPGLIEAIRKINTPLVMVGRALLEKDFDKSNLWNQDLLKVQRLVENDDKIIRLGFVSQEDLVMLYNTATVFVMPSIYEGFGLPILEAMSCGCPVVTSREGSIPEIAGDAAYFVDACSVDSISKGIQKIVLHKSLQEILSLKGLLQAKKFSWETTAKKTIESYEKALLTTD